MPRICIYTRPAGLCAGSSASFDSEHWFSRGLGEFQNFEELDGKVCKDCNNLFGRQLEDVFLHSGPEAQGRIYTFWDYFRNLFGRDRGLRIDHLLLSPSLAPRLVGAAVDREVRAWEKASDHAPTWVQIAD
jgi:exonuclease III